MRDCTRAFKYLLMGTTIATWAVHGVHDPRLTEKKMRHEWERARKLRHNSP